MCLILGIMMFPMPGLSSGAAFVTTWVVIDFKTGLKVVCASPFLQLSTYSVIGGVLTSFIGAFHYMFAEVKVAATVAKSCTSQACVVQAYHPVMSYVNYLIASELGLLAFILPFLGLSVWRFYKMIKAMRRYISTIKKYSWAARLKKRINPIRLVVVTRPRSLRSFFGRGLLHATDDSAS
jgi:hypothetical protein